MTIDNKVYQGEQGQTEFNEMVNQAMVNGVREFTFNNCHLVGVNTCAIDIKTCDATFHQCSFR